MNTTLKKFVSMFMIFSMVLAINTTAFAAEKILTFMQMLV